MTDTKKCGRHVVKIWGYSPDTSVDCRTKTEVSDGAILQLIDILSNTGNDLTRFRLVLPSTRLEAHIVAGTVSRDDWTVAILYTFVRRFTLAAPFRLLKRSRKQTVSAVVYHLEESRICDLIA